MVPYPPVGFVCEYKDCCPHLNRISTSWVFNQYQRLEYNHGRLHAIIDELDGLVSKADERIAELEREKAELEAKYRALQQKQFKAAKPKGGGGQKDKNKDKTRDGSKPKGKRRKRGAPEAYHG